MGLIRSCRKSQKDTARFRSSGITRAKCLAICRPRKECLSFTEEMAHQESSLPKTSVSSARKCLTQHSSKQAGNTCQISVTTRGPHSEILKALLRARVGSIWRSKLVVRTIRCQNWQLFRAKNQTHPILKTSPSKIK